MSARDASGPADPHCCLPPRGGTVTSEERGGRVGNQECGCCWGRARDRERMETTETRTIAFWADCADPFCSLPASRLWSFGALIFAWHARSVETRLWLRLCRFVGCIGFGGCKTGASERASVGIFQCTIRLIIKNSETNLPCFAFGILPRKTMEGIAEQRPGKQLR
jgi:hypothetical protein